jgi:hypothetical protein
VRLALDERAFAGWDIAAGAWAQLPGPYEIAVGRSSRDLRLRAELP